MSLFSLLREGLIYHQVKLDIFYIFIDIFYNIHDPIKEFFQTKVHAERC